MRRGEVKACWGCKLVLGNASYPRAFTKCEKIDARVGGESKEEERRSKGLLLCFS